MITYSYKQLTTYLACVFGIFLPLLIDALPAIEEKPIAIIIPSYNNIKWYENNLNSVLTQEYKNFRVLYIDDCSTDGTGNAVDEYVAAHDVNHRVKVIHNYERVGALANIYGAVYTCKNLEIVVLVDGDDWLKHPKVLEKLNKVYSSGEIWYTHGTLIEYPMDNVTWSETIPHDIVARNAFREFKCPSHLRTFYTWIFKRIKIHDFLYKGAFLSMAWDMAIMYPIAEMAAERHGFITDVTYVYNMSNPINDNKVDPDLQNFMDKLVRNRPRYQRLSKGYKPPGK